MSSENCRRFLCSKSVWIALGLLVALLIFSKKTYVITLKGPEELSATGTVPAVDSSICPECPEIICPIIDEPPQASPVEPSTDNPPKLNIDMVRSMQSQTDLTIVNELKNKWLRPPSELDYNITHNVWTNVDDWAVKKLHDSVLNILNKKKNGFFIECGAFDGVSISNTLHLEQDYGWTGLLIEADPNNYELVMSRNRKAWTVNVCLAVDPFPGKIKMTRITNQEALSVIQSFDSENRRSDPFAEEFETQCFPLASILAALGQTVNVDYLSLDIEGAELKVLQTVPWNFIYIKVISLEGDPDPAMFSPTRLYLESQDYKYVEFIKGPWVHDYVFVHRLFAEEVGLQV